MSAQKRKKHVFRKLFITLMFAFAVAAIGFMLVTTQTAKQTIEMIIPQITMIGVDSEAQLYANVLPAGSQKTPLSWTSSNEKIVSVDETGYLHANGTGTAIVTVSAGKNLSANCEVKVVIQPLSFGISEDSAVAYLDDEALQLHYSILPENADDYVISWYSSDESILKVDENGVVTAQAIGEAYVTAVTTNQLADSCYITCSYPVNGIQLDQTALTISDSEPVQLNAKLEIRNQPVNESVSWQSSDPSVAYVTEQGLVYAIGNGEAVITARALGSVNQTAECRVTVTGYEGKVIALTFDDGPCRTSLDIAKYLNENDARATFFVIGDQVRSYPNVLRDVFQLGHEIGNHTDDHVSLYTDTYALAQARIEACDLAVRDIIGEYPTVIRAPGGSINAERIAGINDHRYFIHWTLDSQDWEKQKVDFIYENVVKNAKDQSIVLLHDIYPETFEAVKKIVPALQAQGYRFITISELMAITGTDGSHFYNP